VESVALHDALKATPFGGAGHLHLLARREDLNRHLVAKIVSRNRLSVLLELRVVETEAAENAGRDGEAGLGRVADDSLVGATSARRSLTLLVLAGVTLLTIAQLDRVESDFVLGENLDHRVGRSLDHGAGDLLPLFVKDLGHAQLFSNYADHLKPLILSAVRS
jgi:hypothetical protein